MFKFEDSRMVNEGCTYIIKSAWRAKGPMDDKLDNLKQGLAKCKQQLLIWSTKIGGKAKLAAVNRKLKWVEKVEGSKDPAMARKIKEIQQEVDECLEQEDICWKQRVKAHWFQSGNRNTKFFYMCANQRRKTNNICKVQDEGDQIFTNLDDISRVFTDFYHHLIFKTSNSLDMDACVDVVEARVTNEMNAQLSLEFTVEGVSFHYHRCCH